jgi:hypothetical protein
MKIANLLYRMLVMVALIIPALALTACESDRERYHDDGHENYYYYHDHGEMRWNEYFGYYQYYNAYEEDWVSPEEWEYIQLGHWYDPECDCYTQGR